MELGDRRDAGRRRPSSSSSRRCSSASRWPTYLDGAGPRLGRDRGRAHRRGPLEHHLPGRRGGARFVLRRPPRPPLPPSAHDVLREARLLRALAGTPARVPRACSPPATTSRSSACRSTSWRRSRATVITEPSRRRSTRPERARADRRRARRRAGRDPRRRLAGRRPRGLRQAERLPRAPAAPLQRTVGAQQDARAADRRRRSAMARGQPARLPARDDRPRRLPARQHDGRARRRPPGWSPIFDWELATIGDPLADVGYLTVTWVAGRRPRATRCSARCPRSPASEGFPTRDELVARYEERSGRSVRRAALVPGARALEGRRVHGGQLQALPRRLERRRVPGALFDEGVPLLAEKAREIAQAGS